MRQKQQITHNRKDLAETPNNWRAQHIRDAKGKSLPGGDQELVLRIKGIEIRNFLSFGRFVLVCKRCRLEAPIALERISAGTDLAAPEIEETISALAGAPHHLPRHED